MSLLEDIEIRTPDPQLKTHIAELVSFWNGGHYNFQIVSTPPTDSPGGPEIRLFDSGSGSVRLYFYSTISSAWHYLALI